MRIDPTKSLVPGLDLREANPEQKPAAKTDRSVQKSSQGDRVELDLKSELLRINGQTSEAANAVDNNLTVLRVREINDRIKAGFYSTDHALGQSAEGILQLFAG